MSHTRSLYRAGILAGLVLVFTSSPTWASGPGWGDLASGLGRAVWHWLGGLTAAPASKAPRTRVPAKPDCTIDPQGRTHCQPGITPKSGCSTDPLGGVRCDP
jgi:hypothetical protein